MKDLIGKKFGKLTVVSFDHLHVTPNGSKKPKWLAKCECGGEIVTREESLQQGKTMSCGCLQAEAHAKHGHSTRSGRTNTYQCWMDMKARTMNPKHRSFANYGGRGIKVCDRWLEFPSFLEDMGENPGPGYSIERTSNDGNYEPGNCRWATRREQDRNKRSTVMISFEGETMCVSDWERKLGFSEGVVGIRLRSGWPIPKALTTKQRQKP
jgi:hypothetical protein